MMEQNTDRSSWTMITLVVAGIALAIIDSATLEIGSLVVTQVKALFTG
ncbi:hypothetical protein BTS2_3358 [Bacillus sp. TS-2]|nr:hypothetical protein BTS2_3357 [Bacillus sp. TS-2]GAF66457.1 hypothetical protein BTS2_3358 [Bacillus sp. TS-2]